MFATDVRAKGQMNPIVEINNVEELKKVLFLQRTISQRAKNELFETALEDEAGNLPECIEKRKLLLEKYAKYPTLAEFAYNPGMGDRTKWGATFGVTVLVGELIIEQIKHMHIHFKPVVRQMYVLLLNELDNPQHEYLVEPLENALRMEVTDESGGAVSEKQRKQCIRGLVHELVDDFIIISVEYGLVEAKECGFVITPVGRRVLLHLLDAIRFIEEMTTAHARFQRVKPDLEKIS